MHLKGFISLLIVAYLASASQAQRGGRRPRPQTNGDMYEWQVDIGSGILVDQKAIVNSDTNVTLVVTRDRDLGENNMTGSIALYDSSGIVAIRMFPSPGGPRGRRNGRSPCFLTATVTLYEDLVADIVANNGTIISLPIDEQNLNGTGRPMSRQDTREFFRSLRPMARFCRGRRLVETTLSTGQSDDPDTEVKSTLNLGGQVNILTVSQSTNRPRPRPRPFPFPRPDGDNPFPFPRPDGDNPFPFPRPDGDNPFPFPRPDDIDIRRRAGPN